MYSTLHPTCQKLRECHVYIIEVSCNPFASASCLLPTERRMIDCCYLSRTYEGNLVLVMDFPVDDPMSIFGMSTAGYSAIFGCIDA